MKKKIIEVWLIVLSLLFVGEALAESTEFATPTDLEETKQFYTVYYHEYENSAATVLHEMEVGSELRVPNAKEFEYQEADRIFLGWKVYREDDRKWLMETVQGKLEWNEAKAVNPVFYDYAFLQAGDSFSESIINGTKLHFYAQWKPVIQIENINVRIVRTCDDERPTIGSVIRFTAEVSGCDPEYYALQWQTSMDNENWIDIEGAYGSEYSITVTEQNWLNCIRVVLQVDQ